MGGDYFFPEQRHIQHHADDSEDQSVNSHGGRFNPNRDEEMKSLRISPLRSDSHACLLPARLTGRLIMRDGVKLCEEVG